jgi:hypothetical protein
MDQKWVMFGQRFCDIKKHLRSIQFHRINPKYGKSHAFSKKIFKLGGFGMDCELANYLDNLVCNSYPMDIHEIDGILLTRVFYNNYTPDFEYERPNKLDKNRYYTHKELVQRAHQNTITQDDYDFIQDWINKFKIFIEYLLTDFEKDFIIDKHNKNLYMVKKVCKKINKYIVSLQNILELQRIDNHPLI